MAMRRNDKNTVKCTVMRKKIPFRSLTKMNQFQKFPKKYNNRMRSPKIKKKINQNLFASKCIIQKNLRLNHVHTQRIRVFGIAESQAIFYFKYWQKRKTKWTLDRRAHSQNHVTQVGCNRFEYINWLCLSNVGTYHHLNEIDFHR